MSIEDNAVAIFTAFSKTQHLDAEKLAVAPENAISIQDYYIALLRPTWGMDAGYASLAMEQKDSSSPPPTGILLENMFTGTRAVISRDFGFDMQAAAELLVRVRSKEINHATTRLEALNGLKTLIPAVRLSDAYPNGSGIDGLPLTYATNLKVRFCVLGRELQLKHEQIEIENLAEFSVELLDQNEQQLVTATSDNYPHVLDAVLTTLNSLNSRGIEVIAGDILALGPLTESFAVNDLDRLRAVFHGLDSSEDLSVYMGFQ